jgi:hypothetical protein
MLVPHHIQNLTLLENVLILPYSDGVRFWIGHNLQWIQFRRNRNIIESRNQRDLIILWCSHPESNRKWNLTKILLYHLIIGAFLFHPNLVGTH